MNVPDFYNRAPPLQNPLDFHNRLQMAAREVFKQTSHDFFERVGGGRKEWVDDYTTLSLERFLFGRKGEMEFFGTLLIFEDSDSRVASRACDLPYSSREHSWRKFCTSLIRI
ncbi:hypothetical protein CEXT_679151 [Caerostris extrusa]|uniref:Uncharacterized protein n=1 Tax=Caerostris extrusa TaxID=172846 RepID=A0AAV4SNP3_CAEEX|nr:hypothetical protein CEXT_679151 [Caerostris extrusa]